VLDESEHSRDAVYLAYYPRSRAIFASSIKLSLRDIVFHAVGAYDFHATSYTGPCVHSQLSTIETALNCDIEKTKLRSRNLRILFFLVDLAPLFWSNWPTHLEALVDMVLNQDSQGTFRDYRVDNPPLTGTAVGTLVSVLGHISAVLMNIFHLFIIVESQSSVSSLPPLPVVVEDAEMQNQTQQHLIDTFGSSTMPALDRIDLRVICFCLELELFALIWHTVGC